MNESNLLERISTNPRVMIGKSVIKDVGDAPSVVCERYSCNQPQATVTFKVKAETRWGEQIVLTGNDPLLGNWTPASGVRLSPSSYPVWTATISLPASRSFKYKFVKVSEQGAPSWESGEDRLLTTVGNVMMSQDDMFRQ